MHRLWKRTRASFTLVELLVVIAIISVLATLITAAAASAITRAREARILVDIGSMTDALNRYKNEFGEYPPDFTDTALVKRHMAARFPRWAGVAGWTPSSLTQAQALVFWLQGFSANPANPFDTSTTRTPYYQFDQARLVDANNYGPYLPPEAITMPYVYFEARTYAAATFSSKKPYKSDRTADVYVNPLSFQIICSGLDNDYGATTALATFPSGTGYAKGDNDNLVSFSQRNLDKAKP